jgi:hypothetical protein
MDTSKKTSVTVYLNKAQQKALRDLKAVTRVPASEYIRQGIDRVLELEGGSLPVSPARFDSKREGE